ncbi:J domain-containing protein [Burkholderia cepacia]|uniref:J domain-containing protein n=1 Tax=Burkholderia cepacia TaxID=292 RepID=UPI001CF228BA|nr:J domain-containing protein [Burkholderia cepacia]MCA8331848.1 J domain-containing protein [Burkholderia cepacia]
MIAAYPLQWPEGWPRTPGHKRMVGKFSTKRRGARFAESLTVADGVSRVLEELGRFGVRREDIVISTNLRTRLDGLPRSDQRAPDDPGVAVYWETRAGARRVMAIDQYTRVADNLAAVAATLDAMRAIERHGGARILERAFTGFAALAAPSRARHWREVLGVPPEMREMWQVRDAYRRRAMAVHPDRPGGSHDAMAELNAALAAAEKEIRS